MAGARSRIKSGTGLHIGPSEAETFWSGFLKSLARRGLRGVKLVISDAHELKAAIRRVFGATWQRCRVHWIRAHASQTLRHVADQLRQKWPKLAAFIDDSETDVLSYLDFPEQHRTKLHSAAPRSAHEKPQSTTFVASGRQSHH
jgi:putative transposase